MKYEYGNILLKKLSPNLVYIEIKMNNNNRLVYIMTLKEAFLLSKILRLKLYGKKTNYKFA